VRRDNFIKYFMRTMTDAFGFGNSKSDRLFPCIFKKYDKNGIITNYDGQSYNFYQYKQQNAMKN